MDPTYLTLKPVSRREFLNYVWYASMALLIAETGIGIAWYLSASRDIPRKETLIRLNPDSVPKLDTAPIRHDKRIWLSNTSQGFFAFHDYCTHLGCGLKWVSTNNRFECPCHGAKFNVDGTCIDGPARRNLDSIKVIATTPYGEKTTPITGGPVDIADATEIQIDLEVYLYGASRK